MWKNVDAAEKKHWQDKADEAKAEHARLHPNYEVKPRKYLENRSKVAPQSGPARPPSNGFYSLYQASYRKGINRLTVI